MYQVLIVEDDADQITILRQAIGSFSRSSEFAVTSVQSIADLRVRLRADEDFAIVFMDISLGTGEESGIQAVQKYFPAGCGTQVIYVTGHSEYCTSVYRTEHLYFLTKPFEQGDLDDALNKALLNLAVLENQPLHIRSNGKLILVQPCKIKYIESDRRKVRFHVIGQEPLEAYGALSALAQDLPPVFIQCHKSFLVNMNCITELDKNNLVLFSGEEIPVSQNKRKTTKEAFFKHLQMKM